MLEGLFLITKKKTSTVDIIEISRIRGSSVDGRDELLREKSVKGMLCLFGMVQ